MERRVRYERLPEDDDPPAEAVVTAVAAEETEEVVSPSVDVSVGSPSNEEAETAPLVIPSANETETRLLEPPSYNVATSLPSYEEAERTKQEEAARQEETDQQVVLDAPNQNDVHIGTDGIFLCTFIFSFLFNWLGLLVSMCLSQTIAARLGAVAGFGLSIVKWVAIVKHNHWAGGWSEGNSWFWWFLIFLGFMMFCRGCIQYVRIKHQWSQLSHQMRTRALLYF